MQSNSKLISRGRAGNSSFLHVIVVMMGLGWILLSCDKSDVSTRFELHPDFAQTVRQFYTEAALRGIVLDSSNLLVEYSDQADDHTCGRCNSFLSPGSIQNVIQINALVRCWDNAEEREALIFHELGHCLLDRPHLDDTLPNGDPQSMMISGDLTVYAPCRYVFGQGEDCNNVHKRTYYLDEMFDPTTPVPDWALSK